MTSFGQLTSMTIFFFRNKIDFLFSIFFREIFPGLAWLFECLTAIADCSDVALSFGASRRLLGCHQQQQRLECHPLVWIGRKRRSTLQCDGVAAWPRAVNRQFGPQGRPARPSPAQPQPSPSLLATRRRRTSIIYFLLFRLLRVWMLPAPNASPFWGNLDGVCLCLSTFLSLFFKSFVPVRRKQWYRWCHGTTNIWEMY